MRAAIKNKKLAKIENNQYKLFMIDVNVVKTKFVTPVITFLKVIHTTVNETYSSLLKIRIPNLQASNNLITHQVKLEAKNDKSLLKNPLSSNLFCCFTKYIH